MVVFQPSDRRRYSRMSSGYPVQLKQLPQNFPQRMVNTVSHDISEGGMLLSSFQFFPVQARMMVEFLVSGSVEPIRTMGKVIWIEQMPYQDRYKVGIAFAELSEDAKASLRGVMAYGS